MAEIINEIVNNKFLLYSSIGILSFFFIIASVDTYNSLNYEEEDFSFNNFEIDFDIKNRYDCYNVKDNIEYNKCLSFYLKKTPYKLGDVLVPTRILNN